MSLPNDKIDISVIIPARNEEQRLPVFLKDISCFCEKSQSACEVIVVDDGSDDKTSDVVDGFKGEIANLKVIRFNKNRGKSHAVKCGMLRARGEIVLFMDADGSVSSRAIEENLHFFDEGFDVVIGSRVLNDEDHSVNARLLRVFIGKVFNFFVQSFLFKEIKDTQCGFKMFKRKTVRPLFSRLHINGFGFDIELLFLAYKLGYKIKEIPVDWEDRPGSKVNLIVDSMKMFFNILQVRYWHFTPINITNKYMTVEQLNFMHQLESYHWWFQSKKKLINSLLLAMDRKDFEILEVGCGTGYNIRYLTNYGKCCGCDIVDEALFFCKKNGQKNVVKCDIENLSFCDGKFDVVASLDVIEHVEDPDKVLEELYRVLKKKGSLIITVPAFKFLWSVHDNALCHLRRYEKKELETSLMNAGFEIEKIGYFFFTSFLAVAILRILKRFFYGNKKQKSDATTLPPRIFNSLLKMIFKVELKVMSFVPLPFGTTLFAVARKKSG